MQRRNKENTVKWKKTKDTVIMIYQKDKKTFSCFHESEENLYPLLPGNKWMITSIKNGCACI